MYAQIRAHIQNLSLEHFCRLAPAPAESGGARRNRTDDLLLAKQALSQLSYGPARYQRVGRYLSSGPGNGGPG